MTWPCGAPEWKDIMGDDGTGHCRGCGIPLDQFNVECEVCLRALDATNGKHLAVASPGKGDDG